MYGDAMLVLFRGAPTWRPEANRHICHWVLPLKRKIITLKFDVPVFFHPGDVTSFSYFFSWFQYPLSGYLIHNSITNPLVIETLLLIWVAHSLKFRLCRVLSAPALFARTGWLLAQQPSTRFRVPPFIVFLSNFSN